ncbi:MAG: hypothetical protein ACLT3D_08885 [Lawsonibacter sp.]
MKDSVPTMSRAVTHGRGPDTVLQNAYVAVEGTRIASVGTQRPRGALRPGDRRQEQRPACPAWSTPTPMYP